jgi:phage baseplate assembly protein W
MSNRAFSIEDGNMNTVALITGRDKSFSDVDLAFERNSIDDIYRKLDIAAVRQSVKNIVMTNKGEKPFRPLFGTNIQRLLFELYADILNIEIKEEIKTAIATWEPRAIVRDIKVQATVDQYTILVSIIFSIINVPETFTVNTTISRLR